MKAGFAAIIGRPNVGKSTLMNHLIGQKIAITSDRPQTTRSRIETVLTTDAGQVIFVDTPGFIRKANNRLGEYMMDVSVGTLADADVAEAIRKVTTPVILVINKTDLIKKEQLLGIIDAWKDLLPFQEIVPVSGLKARGLDELLTCVFRYLPEGPMLYDEETLTDQPMRQIASEIIREKALKLLSKEVPHGIAVVIDRYKVRDDGLTEIDASVICEKESHKGIVIGKGGAKLKAIGSAARRDLEALTEGKVFLKLFVKVRKDWRDNETLLRDYGYEKKKKP